MSQTLAFILGENLDFFLPFSLINIKTNQTDSSPSLNLM